MNSAARIVKKPVVPLPPGVPGFAVRRFTVDEYHALAEIGILKPHDHYELIDGWIIHTMTVNPPHAYALTALADLLKSLLPADWMLRTQLPVTFKTSEPEPDVVVVPGPKSRYKTAHPTPSAVELLVEIADSSLAEDRGIRLRVYAKAKIAVYWIVNINERCVEVYTQPRGGKNPGYKQQTNYGPDDAVPVVVGGKPVGTIAVKELLP